MRTWVMIAALGCLALATAADARVAGARGGCPHSAADSDTYLELA